MTDQMDDIIWYTLTEDDIPRYMNEWLGKELLLSQKLVNRLQDARTEYFAVLDVLDAIIVEADAERRR